jgi:hypothetical protein
MPASLGAPDGTAIVLIISDRYARIGGQDNCCDHNEYGPGKMKFCLLDFYFSLNIASLGM